MITEAWDYIMSIDHIGIVRKEEIKNVFSVRSRSSGLVHYLR